MNLTWRANKRAGYSFYAARDEANDVEDLYKKAAAVFEALADIGKNTFHDRHLGRFVHAMKTLYDGQKRQRLRTGERHMKTASSDIGRLRTYVQKMTRLMDRGDGDEARMLVEGRELLAALVAEDDWLPDAFAESYAEYFQQYLLYCDPLERFSVVSFVWEPGQQTPIHDHTVWGLVGQLRGAEREITFDRAEDGSLTRTGEGVLRPGEVTAVSPTIGDIHVVANDMPDRPSVSIHVYGANIGAVARHAFVPETGEAKDFVSGYSSAVVPNLWDRSETVRAAL